MDEIQHGRVYSDGSLLIGASDEAIAQRKRLAFAGVVSIGMAITSKGELAGDPDVVLAGLPAKTADGRTMEDIVDKAIFATFESLPRPRRRDADAVSDSIEKAVRNTVRGVWGKRPTVHVLVMEV